MPELPKAYTPHDVEGAIYERWLAADVFAPDGAGSTADPALPPFTIIQPPPNITGSLHLGHAQRTAVEDLMIRHARMRGHRTLFLPGLDHASIAAQFVLDGILAKEGREPPVARSRALPRADARVRRHDPRGHARPAAAGRRVGRLGPPALHDGRGLGQGRPRRLQAAVRGGPRLPHRGARQLVPGLPDERQRPRGHRDARDRARSGRSATTSSTRRPAQPDPDATITIATTRPETILGDTAVAVHPDDARYAALVGRLVRIPFVERDVPIIADDVVDRAFGTGAVKITPAHDHDDHATGLRHGLPALDDPRRRRDDHRHRARATTGWTGTRPARRSSPTSRRAATSSRRRPHEMVIGRCQRSNDVIEPRLKTQWFIRTGPLAARALEATAIGPDADPARAVREDLGALADQHPRLERVAPAVVGPPDPGLVLPGRPRDGVVRARRARTPARSAAGPPPSSSRTRTSSTPGSAPGCGRSRRSAGRTTRPTSRRYYPTSVMETGYDIIFFWVARMMMLGLELTGTEPFHTVYLSGPHPRSRTARRCRRRRATSSTRSASSTSPAPTRCASRSSTARRPATTSGSARPSSSTPATSPTSCGTRRASWSAPGRRRIPDGAERRLPDDGHLGPAERWLLSRAAATTAAVDAAMAGYAFGEVTRLLYEAIWSEYCDWGLELAKVRLADERLDRRGARGDLVDARRGARHVPAAAPPGHAVRDRGAVGGAAAPGDATRSCSSSPAGPGRGSAT